MESAQLTQAALAALHPLSSTQSQPFNHAEACRLRGKILGVLIRSIRLEAERSQQECAEFLHVDNQLVEEWEFGDQVPSLPQLELLSRYLKSGTDGYPDGDTDSQPSSREQYLILRQRLIGAMLRAAREAVDLSIAELGAQTALDMDLLERYELGELQIPLSQLTALAQAVDQDLNYFVGTTGFAPKAETSDARPAKAGERDPMLHQWAADSANADFIRLAMAFRSIERENLHRIADALFAIIKANERSNGNLDHIDPLA